jgi:hypothetical protein
VPNLAFVVTPLAHDLLMATCNFCSQEMTDGVSCSVEVLHRDGAALPLKKVHKRDCCDIGDHAGRCGDCGAPRLGYHHLGCDLQQCPRCRHQMVSCGCWFDEDGTNIAEEEDMFRDFFLEHWGEYLDAS